jgi:hypothetical protein
MWPLIHPKRVVGKIIEKCSRPQKEYMQSCIETLMSQNPYNMTASRAQPPREIFVEGKGHVVGFICDLDTNEKSSDGHNR